MPLADVPPEDFGNPAPEPRQVFAIGLNYANHAAEALLAVPEDLTVFTKFASSLAGPYGTVTLPPGTVDWEDRGLGGRARGNHRPRRLAHTRGQGMELVTYVRGVGQMRHRMQASS